MNDTNVECLSTLNYPTAGPTLLYAIRRDSTLLDTVLNANMLSSLLYATLRYEKSIM
jgi:hypothetical protein